MKQKTWLELLGPVTASHKVDGRHIVRQNYDRFVRVWSFDTLEQALAAFKQWKAETDQATTPFTLDSHGQCDV